MLNPTPSGRTYSTEGSVHLLTGVPVSRDEGGEAGHHEGGGHGVQAEAQVELRQRGAEAHYHEAGYDQQQAPAHTPVIISAANRLIGEVVQSRRRPPLGPSPG